ncbi:6786_t:CDS:2 [Paraglomus brasilianum]|uniref:6786_t:CDS:1 n=1 Tax=Paraglomus brasilianum TaxID=144538 RepID=A0A9N8VCX6_9GLOM|nr:6786_t:CDS:2 [Paraglomus brasilianum]
MSPAGAPVLTSSSFSNHIPYRVPTNARFWRTRNPREDVLKGEEEAENISKYEVEDCGGDEAKLKEALQQGHDECQTVLSAHFESARCNESSYAAAVAIAVNRMHLKTTNKCSNTTSIKPLARRIPKWRRYKTVK